MTRGCRLIPHLAMLAFALVTLRVHAEPISDERTKEVREMSRGSLQELAPSTPGYRFGETQFVEFPRRYREVKPSEVLEAARDKLRTDVRFKDTVRALVKQEGFLCPRIGFQLYPVGARFETETGLTVAVPHLHYTPWLDEHVARARALKPGQEVIVEGFVEGPVDDRPTAFADRIIMPEEKASQVTYELKCGWPGAGHVPPLIITEPGQYTMDIPGSSNQVRVRVKKMNPDVARALMTAIRFSSDTSNPAPKMYKQAEVESLGKMDEPAHVRFTDRVRAIAVPEGDDASVETGAGVKIPIEICFKTDAGVRCLIPRAAATLIERSSRHYPGYRIEFEGTLLPGPGDEPLVLIDDFRQAAVTGPVESCPTWVVEVSHADGPTHVFASPGTYELDLPVTDEKTELLIMSMRQIRTLEPIKRSEIDRYIGQLDRRKFSEAHGGTVFVQFCLEELGTEGLAPNKFTYPPLWATIEPGMTLERHHHPFPEFYVFTNGKGTMMLGDEEFPVQKDMAVYIPSDEWHTVSIAETATEPLTWLSIGLKPNP